MVGADGRLPDFSAMTPNVIERGAGAAVAVSDDILATITAVLPAQQTFANTFAPFDAALDVIHQALWQYAFMSYVSVDSAVRDVARAAEERLKYHLVELWLRDDLFRAVSSAAERIAPEDIEQKRLLEHVLREYRRHGSGLTSPARARIRQLSEELAGLAIQYQKRIDDWDDYLLIDRGQLAGMSDAFIDSLSSDEAPGGPRYRVSIDEPEYSWFMSGAESSALRRELFVKYETVGGPENITVLERALEARRELAGLLGYDSWAAYRHETCVAGQPERVDAFLRDIRDVVLPRAHVELALLKQVHGFPPSIWDHQFAISRALSERYAVSKGVIAPYFPLDACLDGLFAICGKLFNLRFAARPDVPVWHDDVLAFDVHEVDGPEPFARFYLDLFPRPNKFAHVAVFGVRHGRRRADGSYQSPVAVMVGNFTAPRPGVPALLGHGEVTQLFHEFGHVLHVTLARGSFSSIEVEADFIEVPSQLIERWASDREIVAGFGRHYETGATIPDALLDDMHRMKDFHSATLELRQLYYASVDLALHSPDFRGDSTAVVRDLHDLTMFPCTPGTYFQSGWWHLFTYDARYYGYLWAQVQADDMFTRFERGGLLNRRIGMELRRKVLERRGAVDGGVAVRDFLGRDPTRDAFMRRFSA